MLTNLIKKFLNIFKGLCFSSELYNGYIIIEASCGAAVQMYD